MVELNVSVKARKRQDIKPKNVLGLVESDRPYVIMPDGTVYEGTCQDDERFSEALSEPARFTDDAARAFAARHKGVYFPSSGARNASFTLKSFIEGVRRLCNNLPRKVRNALAKKPDFLKDLEGELKYLGEVSPITCEEAGRGQRVYGLVGPILDERAISSGRYDLENFRLFGPKGRQYAIGLGLCLHFFGERDFSIAGRFLSMHFPGAESDEFQRLEEMVNNRYARTEEFSGEHGAPASIRMSRHMVQTSVGRGPETSCHLAMMSPYFSLTDISHLENYAPPMSTAQMLEKFVPIADLVFSAAEKLARQSIEKRMSEAEENVRKALGDAYYKISGNH